MPSNHSSSSLAGQERNALASSEVGAPRRVCRGLGSCLGTRRWVHEWDPARSLAKGVSHCPSPALRHAPRAGGCLIAALTPPASRQGRMNWPEMLVSPSTPRKSRSRECPCCSRVGQHCCGSRDNPHPLGVVHGEGNWPNIRYFSPRALQPYMEPPPLSTAPIPAPSCLSRPFPP